MTLPSNVRGWVGLSAAALSAIALATLLPVEWVPPPGLHWLIEHFVGYFALTTIVCIAWPRPVPVAAVLMVLACSWRLCKAPRLIARQICFGFKRSGRSAGGCASRLVDRTLSRTWLLPDLAWLLHAKISVWPFRPDFSDNQAGFLNECLGPRKDALSAPV